ncbi:MAG: 3-deoxy-D-manno-octulosonic acid transferase, partial [Gemmataceae bacterium]|nr:3-deoxy-D-manno-octulosonic acid transferase [Gemmataceae bacterium]
DTGYDEACKHFVDLPVFFWPFDFTWAVKTALGRVQPDLVVLAEGELWPNFLRIARRYGVKVAVVNGRMSPKSARRHRRLRWLTRGLFRRLNVCAVQTEEIAEHFRVLGARKVEVTGSVKYDGANIDRRNPRTLQMRKLLGIGPEELVLVAGSTQDPEEEIILGVYRRVLEIHPNLRLILVPRQKERFDPVAEMLKKSGLPFVRRSQIRGLAPLGSPVVLLDTFGELSAVWGLADVAFVGGSLDGMRGGQNMIEPAAYGAAALFGPHTWNFKDTVARLLACGGAIQVQNSAELENQIVHLLANVKERCRLGDTAHSFVLSQQGATQRTVDALAQLWLDDVKKLAA